MRAENLMIGDWVIVTNSPKPQKQVKPSWYSYHWTWWINFLEPIPITKDILVNNGFTQVKNEKNEYHKHLEDGYISVYIKKENAYIHYHNHECDSLNIKRRYVHEFQHALRLCGLGKLANDFKI